MIAVAAKFSGWETGVYVYKAMDDGRFTSQYRSTFYNNTGSFIADDKAPLPVSVMYR